MRILKEMKRSLSCMLNASIVIQKKKGNSNRARKMRCTNPSRLGMKASQILKENNR